MSRDIDSLTSAATEAAHQIPVWFLMLDFASGIVRATTAPFSIFFDGDGDGIDEEYLGVGSFGSLADIDETEELKANTARATLSGIPTELIAIALGEHYQGRRAKAWEGRLDADHQLVGPPVCIWGGRIDTMDITEGETATIEVALVSPLEDWNRVRGGRYNDADQQARYPGDKGFEFVPQMVEFELTWGRG